MGGFKENWKERVAGMSMGPELSQAEISSAEIRIIRWGEKILTPLLVAGFVGVITFLIHVSNTMAQLTNEQGALNKYKDDINQTLHVLDARIEAQNKVQQKTEITLQRIDTNQQHFKDQIIDLKIQNAEIIRLLRTREVMP